MSIGQQTSRGMKLLTLAATLLIAPRMARPAAAHNSSGVPATELWQEQDDQDRAQEARDREQEKRDREQERLDRAEELYDNGREALDEDRYDRAEQKFKELADMGGAQADAALYWKAYAENKQGKKDLALAAIADLKKRYPQSRWQKDASALEIEVRQSTGQPYKPEADGDEGIKMLAIQGLMNSDPERAMPLLEKVLNGTGSPKEKSKALFVIAQSGSPQAREILGLRLNADLVTLSACETGSGKVQGQEGVSNLVRPFLAAGARAVVANLWSADDTFSLVLMKEFYRALAAGQDKATALQTAKRKIVKEFGPQATPKLWAGLELHGDGRGPVVVRHR